MPFDEDMSVFFDVGEFASLATWNGDTQAVIYDAPAQDVLTGEAIGTEYSLTMPAGVWPGAAYGASITVPGKGTFTVREVRPINDGLLKKLVLAVGA
jgi:hypothetical protein